MGSFLSYAGVVAPPFGLVCFCVVLFLWHSQAYLSLVTMSDDKFLIERDLDDLQKILIPEYSRAHPIIPKLYVPEWKTDMPNRCAIMQNAFCGTVPIFEHDENLFLEKREQMHYNSENWTRVSEKIHVPSRVELLRPDFHHETSRYQSELMMRRDENAV